MNKCEHEWSDYDREIFDSDGRICGGTLFCVKCGISAIEDTLENDGSSMGEVELTFDFSTKGKMKRVNINELLASTKISERNKEIFVLYRELENMSEVSRRYKITQSRISQILQLCYGKFVCRKL